MCTWSPHIGLASQPAADTEPEELARQPRQDIVKALQSLIQQVSGLQSDNDRLRVDNDRLSTEIERIRALMREAGGEIARRASRLLADTEDQRPPTSEPSSLKLHFVPGPPAPRRGPPFRRGPPAASSHPAMT
jgi:septal ring factor EnvC (AmiA/AmiB activator)